MSYRTTDEAVGGLIDVDSGVDLEPFILTANELVTEICATDSNGYTEQRLELIERWLSAHFYAVFDQQNQLSAEKVGPLSASYATHVGPALKLTRWGQQVLFLDTKGGLAALNARTEKGNTQPLGLSSLGRSCEDDF